MATFGHAGGYAFNEDQRGGHHPDAKPKPDSDNQTLSEDELTERFYLVREQRNKLLWAAQKALAAFDSASTDGKATWSGKDVDEMRAAVANSSSEETNADLEEIDGDALLKLGFTGGNDEPERRKGETMADEKLTPEMEADVRKWAATEAGRVWFLPHLVAELDTLKARIAELERERDKLQAFKTWTHDYLDRHGVPHHPPGTHGAEGCRIGDRMDWLMAKVEELVTALQAAGRSKCVMFGHTTVDDEHVLCWCHCLSDRCMDEPRCAAARALLATLREQPTAPAGEGAPHDPLRKHGGEWTTTGNSEGI